jgi:hypothetical protein
VLSFLVLETVSTVWFHGSVTLESRMVGFVPENLKVMKLGFGADIGDWRVKTKFVSSSTVYFETAWNDI